MKWAIGTCCLLLALAAGARFWIFRLQDKEISPEYYQRKMRLEDFALPETAAPQGFRMPPNLSGGFENPSELKPSELARAVKAVPAFPAPSKIVAAHAAAYASALGDEVVLVACQYGGAADAPAAPAGFQRHGVFLVTAVSSTPLLRDSFMNALSEHLTKLKADSVKLNKVKTIGNVLLKLFMDILVGAFAFILALFLAKYFLILKRVEE
ncbi:MAG: hypothetical protein HYY25_14095 [Candidatus Wallbacteria bacterium]|nr:hypothetical protein [Candidatus Wallbacteria bacterium]